MSCIQLEIQHNVLAIVTINRPEKRNALSFAALKALIDTAKLIKRNRNIRAVILRGNGEHFSAGIDLSELNSKKQRVYAFWQLLKPSQSLFQQACLVWQQLPIPVIAVIDGYCLGAGMQLALACDYRIAAANSQFAIMESRWGLIPDMGLSKTLADVINIDQAKDLTFSARIIPAEQALELGLISQIHQHPLTQAQSLALEYAERSPDALKAGKQLLNALQQRKKSVLCLEKLWQLRLMLGKNSAIARRRGKHADLPYRPRS